MEISNNLISMILKENWIAYRWVVVYWWFNPERRLIWRNALTLRSQRHHRSIYYSVLDSTAVKLYSLKKRSIHCVMFMRILITIVKLIKIIEYFFGFRLLWVLIWNRICYSTKLKWAILCHGIFSTALIYFLKR